MGPSMPHALTLWSGRSIATCDPTRGKQRHGGWVNEALLPQQIIVSCLTGAWMNVRPAHENRCDVRIDMVEQDAARTPMQDFCRTRVKHLEALFGHEIDRITRTCRPACHLAKRLQTATGWPLQDKGIFIVAYSNLSPK